MLRMTTLLLFCFGSLLFGSAAGTGFVYQVSSAALQHMNPGQRVGPQSESATHRRNWCQYTVTKMVSCQVHNGSETVVQRVYQSCRWPGPCANVVRTLIRPTYRVAYRSVTALEWRCCPGFLGDDCSEECMNCSSFSDVNNRLHILESKVMMLGNATGNPTGDSGRPVIFEPPENEVYPPRPVPAGQPGPQGPPGVRGLPGLTGPTGERGPIGESGRIGPVGPEGRPGLLGPRGYPGETGLPGPPGPPIPRGDVYGLESTTEGDNGESPLPPTQTQTGRPGPPGPEGPPGPSGSAGPPGAPGPPGRDGERGFPGRPGAKGEVGDRGPPGRTGEVGLPGEPGLKGEMGEPGERSGEMSEEDEGVQQLREALKILAERVLILEHMIGIHDPSSSVEPGSGLDLSGSTQLPSIKTKRAGWDHLLLTDSNLIGQDSEGRGRK